MALVLFGLDLAWLYARRRQRSRRMLLLRPCVPCALQRRRPSLGVRGGEVVVESGGESGEAQLDLRCTHVEGRDEAQALEHARRQQQHLALEAPARQK